MIKKLKIKIIFLSLTAVLVILTLVVAGMNIVNYRSVSVEADTILSLLSQNGGRFPENDGARPSWLPKGMSAEMPYETRFFSVLLTSDGTPVLAETSRIFSVDKNLATKFANIAFASDDIAGFVEDYRFVRQGAGEYVRITFLDCGRRLEIFRNFLLTSVIMSLAGFAAVATLVVILAGRLIKPVAESYEKQKRFITDAGHEIKTPLTIIGANADLLSMDIGDNEYLTEIVNQTKRLGGLTGDLVSLAKMEEAEGTVTMIDFPVSEVALDTATPFVTLAGACQKRLCINIQPMLTMNGNQKAFSQLVSILLDNAIKYSPDGTDICLSLARQGRKTVLSVSNISATEMSGEDLKRIFDRFYRTDPSRNSETGGHGIGLSMANAIVAAHGGKIAASVSDGVFTMTATF